MEIVIKIVNVYCGFDVIESETTRKKYIHKHLINADLVRNF